MKIRINILVIFLILLISIAGNAANSAEPQNNHFHSYLRKGIDKAFNLETAAAGEYIMKTVELDPENPTGFAYLAMLNLCFYEMSLDQNDRNVRQEALLHYARETIVKGEKRIKNNPHDGQAYFAMSLAKIAKVQWAIHQKRYFVIAQETSDIWDYLEKAKQENPQNPDTYFLMGLLHYHLSHLPGFIRFLSSAFIVAGNNKKGLQELELAAQKGDLLKELAQAELASAYINIEKQPAKALPLAMELNKRFPDNYNFSFVLGNVLADLHRFDEALNIAREIEKNIQTQTHPFVPQLQPRYNQLMGRISFNKGEYESSMEYFHSVLKDTSFYNARSRVWALVRLGMIHDIRKERKQAEEYYLKALEEEGGEGAAQIEAKKYLKNPYTPVTNQTSSLHDPIK
jgi:tetratricopeptide (TPR) repeat protein